MKLPTEFKTKWLEALRSGRYAQGRKQLKDGVGFCCLGVAVDFHNGREAWTSGLSCAGYPPARALPEDVFMVLAGLGPDGWDGRETNIMTYLAEMNDIQHKSFLQIADWIEENL
jgi:hypothetical protein